MTPAAAECRVRPDDDGQRLTVDIRDLLAIEHEIDPALADEDRAVATETAYEMVRRLAREEGLLGGISSGAALAASLQVARRLTRGVVVTVFPDGAEKYLTEPFWNVDA